MPLKLKPAEAPLSPFSWEKLPGASPPPDSVASLPSPPTAWLPARDMKLYGAHPLTSTSDIGLVKCTDCDKPILRSFMAEHAVTCATVRSSPKKSATKSKAFVSADGDDSKKASKKRKASPEPADPSQPPKKKTKPIPKVTKGRLKGPVDLDQQCGVINDKNLPCSRSLTCKSHSMGAKRAVEGRSRKYDDLLIEWQRKHNPNFVEPVKRETKAEKKEKKEKEKLEKKKLADEQAAALGIDPSTVKKQNATSKKSSKKASAATGIRVVGGDEANENLDDLDSEAELDELIHVFPAMLAVANTGVSFPAQRQSRKAMAEEDDYEALPANAGYMVNMFAGALAGISEHAVMYPIDSIKTRMQVFSASPVAIYSGVGNAFTRISSTEGIRALWRGVSSTVLGAGPAHAVHFGTLEAVRELASNMGSSPWLATYLISQLWLAQQPTTAADALMNPFDVIKQRMQVHKSEFRSVLTCARVVFRNEGLAAFYVSYPTTLAISIPFNAIQFTVYEQVKDLMNPRRTYSPSSHIVAGGVAGAVAAAVTTPLDVAKTLLQTRGTAHEADLRNVGGMLDALRVIWARDGFKGYARGLTPRVLTIMPSSALCWMSYEFFKAAIRTDS
ncbi:hypothetical protein MIND_00337600 [Mycena indigotica]|uniref:SCA7 domain-containing protein n=1 Tax=Mycena indigotica TaxID=2126181 RepID=A0A8H6T0F1_9AGAR|nr:uncharacterized protein MIND_00337600 [Mycena indigotica]KAF7309665.1 hypothetical protein MIND_00337600 [Mycena indigotica]